MGIRRLPELLCLSLVLLPAAGHADELLYSLSAGAGYTDNVALSPGDGESETLLTAGLAFSWLKESRLLRAEVLGDVAWYDYVDNTFDDQLLGGARADLSWELIENRLRWSVQDIFGQTTRDLTAARTPDNNENVNFLATGPDVRFGVASDMELLLAARYALVDYEDSNLDSARAGGQVGIAYTLSDSRQISLRGAMERIEARGSSLVYEHDRQEAFLRFSVAGARTTIQADAGATRIKGNEESDTGELWRLSFTRKLGTRMTTTLSLGREFTDAGNALGTARSALDSPVADANALSQTGDPYANTFVNAGWEAQGLRTTVGLAGNFANEDYGSLSLQPNRQRYGGNVFVARLLGPRTQVRVGHSFAQDEIDGPLDGLREHRTTASIGWRAGRRLWVDLDGERYKFSGSESGDELRGWLRLRYGDEQVQSR